jgi:hypothetical protein
MSFSHLERTIILHSVIHMTPSLPLSQYYLPCSVGHFMCTPTPEFTSQTFYIPCCLEKLAMGIFCLALFVTQPHDKSLAST